MNELALEVVVDDDIDDLIQTIHQGFDAIPLPENVELYRSTPLAFALRNERGDVEGGITGRSVWGWLYVKYLWVAEIRRGQGLGKWLLDAAEREAEQRGCHSVWLSTISYQAPAFYRHQGYEPFGELPDFPPGHKRLFYKKHLTAALDQSKA